MSLVAALIALFAPLTGGAAAPSEAVFDAKVQVLGAFFQAVKVGDQKKFALISAADAKAKIEFKDAPFAMASFAEFAKNCKFDRQRTVAYDRLAGVHFLYDCSGRSWAVNAWIEHGRVKYLSAFWTPPGA